MSALVIVVAYLATAVLPAAWAMRAAVESSWGGRCLGSGTDGKRRLMDGSTAVGGRGTCVEWHGPTCWRAEGIADQKVVVLGTAAGLLWPLLLMPALALLLAKRKPTAGALERRIAELERENDL